jgi:hypothetical protein
MKRLFFLILFSGAIASQAQNLDTVIVRTETTLPLVDWLWMRGKGGMANDSLTLVADKRINAELKKIPGLTAATLVTLDSLPGRMMMGFYRSLRAYGSERASRYNTILTALTAHPTLAYWIGRLDGAISRDSDQAITLGKNLWVD